MAKNKKTLLEVYERLEREQIKFIADCESNGKSYANPQKGENIRRADQKELKRIQTKLAELRELARGKKSKVKSKPVASNTSQETLDRLMGNAENDDAFLLQLTTFLSANASTMNISGSKHDIYDAVNRLLIAAGQEVDDTDDE
jgi:hypothetical protein